MKIAAPFWNPLRSISAQIAVLLVLLVLPLNVVSILATGHSSRAMEEQALQNIHNVTSLYLNDLQNRAQSATKYIAQQMVNNSHSISVLHQRGDGAYVLAKYALSREFIDSSQWGHAGDIYYFYSPALDDVLISRREVQSTSRSAVAEFIRANVDKTHTAYWSLVEIDGSRFVIRSSMSHGMYFGALICLDAMVEEIPALLEYTSCRVTLGDSPPDPPQTLVVESRMENADFSVRVAIDRQEVVRGMGIFQRIQQSFTFLYLALIPVLLLILRWMLILPLREVNTALTSFRGGDSAYRIPDRRCAREFVSINRDFNDMAQSIEQLKIENYEQQVARQQVELQNFQLTIRPHFLQNTFGLLYTLSQAGESEKLGGFILYLSRYFRSIYQGIQNLIPFESELSLIKSYMDIAAIQYPGNIAVEYRVDTEVLTAPVPALLIHNFFENAISHALDRGTVLHITLRGRLQGGVAHFEVSDDGVGMDARSIERVNAGECFGEDGRKHIGLSNTYQRLQILYRGGAGMRISSERGKGTAVNVWIPLQEEAPNP